MGDAVQAKAVEFIARPRACANDYPIVLAELRPVGVGQPREVGYRKLQANLRPLETGSIMITPRSIEIVFTGRIMRL